VVVFTSPTEIVCSSSSCIDGFHRSSIPSRSFDRRPCAAERLIGSIRRECVDHIVVLGETHLRRVLKSYARYYNGTRTHRSLDKDAPISRAVQRDGSIMSHALLGGLHHHYIRV
jgi:Integrase core domain